MTKVAQQNVSKIQFYKKIRLGQNSKGILKRFTTPYQDLALALGKLVSSNIRYVRKTLFNCGGCEAIIRNTSFCPCGTAQEFPALLFKRTWKKSFSILRKLEKISLNTIQTSPPTPVSLHYWARVILTRHGVVFSCLLSSTTGMVNLTTCNCFATAPPESTTHEIEEDDNIVLDTSGSLFLDKEVGIILQTKNPHADQ